MPSDPSAPAMKTHIKLTQVMLAAMDDLLGLHFAAEKTLRGLVKKTTVRQLSEKEKEAIRLYEEGLQKTLDIIAPAGMIVKPNELILNDLHARTLYTVNWPNYVYPNWLSEEINFDAHMNICQFIYPANSKVIMKMLRKKVTEMRSSVRMLEQRGIVRDPALEAALQDAEELRDLLARGREKLFQMGLYLTIYSDDEEKLKKLETDVESLLGGKLIITKPAFMQMEHGWLSTMPFGIDELEINRNMNTSPLAACFPFSSSDLTDDHGILYGINRHNDSLVIFDRFDLPNANASVFATSGAGKSFTIKLEILRSLMFDTEVYVVDPENEYRELCETVGGTYFRISLESSNHINPFELPKSIRGDEATPGETLRAAVINLHGLLKLMLGTLTPAEDGILDKAILDTYALKGITLATEDAATKMPPTLHDLVDVLETTEGGESMAMTLCKFTEGSYAGLFDQQTNIQLDNQMVVFQIRDLEDQLRPIAMFVIINLIWNRIRAEFKKRMLVIDEAWNLIQYEDSARFLYGLIKRARKYYLGVTTITQDVEDFVNSPYGKPIITNAALQILLKQSPSAVDNLQKIFYLTEGEKYLLLNSDVGQGLFFAGNRHVAIQIVASPKEAQIISTKPEDILAHKQQEKLEKERTAAEKKAPPIPQQMVTADEVATTLQHEEDAQQEVKDQDTTPPKTEPPPVEAAPAEPPKPPEAKRVTEAEDVASIANATLMQATPPQTNAAKKPQETPAEASAEPEATPPEKPRGKKKGEG